MPFSSLPRGTTTVVILSILILVVWMIWGSFNYPEALWAPGNLSRYHTDVNSCSQCHEPFQGITVNKCASCHNEKQFAERSKPAVSEFHRNTLREGKICVGCHTEHRGALAQITVGAMENPHCEFVFRATGTRSCTACHDFSTGFELRNRLLDNVIVRRLMNEGEGAHRPGKMTYCLKCHRGGRLEIEDDDLVTVER